MKKRDNRGLSPISYVIDSLTPQDHDIPSLLGAMRMRIEPQLESSGLKLHWQVSELPAVADFGPHTCFAGNAYRAKRLPM